MPDKFKVGDRVRCTIDGDTGSITQKANNGTWHLVVGELGS